MSFNRTFVFLELGGEQDSHGQPSAAAPGGGSKCCLTPSCILDTLHAQALGGGVS